MKMLSEIKKRYDPENDLMPSGFPRITWAEYQLCLALKKALSRIEQLESRVEELESNQLDEDNSDYNRAVQKAIAKHTR